MLSSRAGWRHGLAPPGESTNQTAVAESQTGLPLPLTTFVGRQLEIQALSQRLRQPSTRLLTLTGPGGSGKTRLAIELARELTAEFADGIYLIDLSLLSDPQLVPSAIAAALGVREWSSQPVLQRVQERLRDRVALLVVDNFEHLLASAPVLNEVLATCPSVKVLATSRMPLGLYGEHEFPVQPLAVPDVHLAQTCSEVAPVEAVQLFIERAQATRPDFELTDANAATVAEICIRLDGLPLALELAAARVRLLTPAALLSRLERSLSLLTGGARDRPARQQTLRAAIDWSYELLEPGEQRLFRQLGVFTGGFTLEAAEAVCELSGPPALDVLDSMEALGRASLVRQVDHAGETRFEMLETVREFAAEQLEQSGELEPVRSRHADYFLALAEKTEPLLHGPQQRQWFDRLEREEANMRAVLEWSLRNEDSEQGVRLAGALWWFWLIRSYLTEGRRWAEAAVAASPALSPLVRAKALYCAAFVATFQNDRAQGKAWAEAALAICREFGDDRGAAYALACLGLTAMMDGDAPPARAAFEESARLFRATADAWGLRTVLNGFGELERLGKNFERAETLYTESLSVARQEQDAHGVGLLLLNLAILALQQSVADRAADLIAEASQIWSELGYRQGLVACVGVLASIAALRERWELAIRLFGTRQEVGDQVGRPELEYDRLVFEHYRGVARARVDASTWDAAWAAGKKLSVEQAVAEGLSAERTPTTVPAQSIPTTSARGNHEPLTVREWEVAQLVARGLTNRQIASELIVSEATAAKHVENIREKLELNSRTQVAAWVFERVPRGG
ncbi:MAG TPA: LuxR C-terminal-related transcriptional regulator [Chloroflexota bacterium]